jgi:hypothetical protein
VAVVLTILLAVLATAWSAPSREPSLAARVTTLDRLPFVIRQPGRYVLAGNLTLREKPRPGEAMGIVVQSHDVTIDLAGFTLAGSLGSAHGIAVVLPEDSNLTAYRGLVVRGGTVRNWGGHGIQAMAGRGCRFESLTLATNGTAGEPFSGLLAGAGTRVIDCMGTANALHGIEVGLGSVVTGSIVSANGGSGFVLGAGSICRTSTATGNMRDGFFLVGPGGLVESCSASGNRRDGFRLAGPGQVRGCSSAINDRSGLSVLGVGLVSENLAYGNGGAGVELVAPDSRVDANHLAQNLAGLRISTPDSVAVRNTVAGNTDDLSFNTSSFLGGWLGRAVLTTAQPTAFKGLKPGSTTVPPAWMNLQY